MAKREYPPTLNRASKRVLIGSSKTGVSVIIGALILVVIAVGVAVAAYAYASSAAANLGSASNNLIGNSGNALAEQVNIAYASFNLTSGGPASSYVPITITNSQTTPTPSPFQQSLTINPSLYTSLEATDIGNIRFFLTLSNQIFSNPVSSWLESVSSAPANLATSATFWLDITGGIAASSLVTVYLDFQPVSTEFDGAISGEAPQLSATYGQYDNGANIFTQYGGKSWSSFTFQSGTWSTSNGYLQQTGTTAIGGTAGGPAAVIESTQYSVFSSYVVEMAFNYTTQATARVGIITDATPTGAAGSGTADTYAYRFIGQQSNNGPGFVSFLNDQVAWVVNNVYQGAISTSYSLQITDAAGTWSGNLYSGYSVTGSIVTSLANTAYTTNNNQGAASGYIGISASYYNGAQVLANPINVQWFRMRAYPPNGVMPLASSEAVSQNNPPQAGVVLSVQNFGINPIIISSVYIQNELTGSLAANLLLSTPLPVQSGALQAIAIDFTPMNAVPYKITVVTLLGTQVSTLAIG